MIPLHPKTLSSLLKLIKSQWNPNKHTETRLLPLSHQSTEANKNLNQKRPKTNFIKRWNNLESRFLIQRTRHITSTGTTWLVMKAKNGPLRTLCSWPWITLKSMMKSLKRQESNLNKTDQRQCFSKDLPELAKPPVPKSLLSKSTFLSFTCPSKPSWASITEKAKKSYLSSGRHVKKSVKSLFSSMKSTPWLEVETATCMKPVEEFFQLCWEKLTVSSLQQTCCWFALRTESRIWMLQCWAGLTWALSFLFPTNTQERRYSSDMRNTWVIKSCNFWQRRQKGFQEGT